MGALSFTIENVTTGDLAEGDLALFDPVYGYERVTDVIVMTVADADPWKLYRFTVETRIFFGQDIADAEGQREYAYRPLRYIERTAEPILRFKPVRREVAQSITEVQEAVPVGEPG